MAELPALTRLMRVRFSQNPPMEYETEESDILLEERSKPRGERLTKFNCTICKKPLSEAALSEIRWAHAPCAHSDCCILQYHKEQEKKSFFSKLWAKIMGL